MEAGDDEAEVSGLLEFSFEPLPLIFAEGVRLGALVVAIVARVKNDDLGASACGSKDAGVVGSVAVFGNVIAVLPELAEEGFSLFFERVVFTFIISAVVMVVPSGHDDGLFAKFFEGGFVG